jgi:hypothetical protein
MRNPGFNAAEDGDELPEPPALRRLRWLVTALTAVLIVGVIIIVGALLLRITQPPPADDRRPTATSLVVPTGERITASGTAPGAMTLVTVDGDGVERLRLYDPETGRFQRAILIERQGR